MISRNRASPCRNAQKAWLILAKPPAKLPIKLDCPSSEDPVGAAAPLALIATPQPFLCFSAQRPRVQFVPAPEADGAPRCGCLLAALANSPIHALSSPRMPGMAGGIGVS